MYMHIHMYIYIYIFTVEKWRFNGWAGTVRVRGMCADHAPTCQ